MTRSWLCPPLILLALLSLSAGCGGEEADTGRLSTLRPEAQDRGQGGPASRGAGKAVPLEAGAQALAGSGAYVQQLTVRSPGRRLGLRAQSVTPGDEGGYDRFVQAVLPLIDEFWRNQMFRVSRGTPYQPPGHLISYDGADNPGCLGRQGEEMIGNAYWCPSLVIAQQCSRPSDNQTYCLQQDLIAWDKTGLLFPFYREIGDLAVALVLAHEWGHLVQARVFPAHAYETTIRRELQADCYAGAWALEMRNQGRVDIGAFNQTLGLFDRVGGSGEAWLDPSSHGTKFQRIRAFTGGFEEGVEGCVGASFDRLLLRIGLAAEG